MLYKENHLILIGAQKAGSTWVQHVLDSDCRVCTSTDQEVKYLNRRDAPNFQHYCSLFPNCSMALASADVTPAYMSSSRALHRLENFREVYNFVPKIVVVLREPVQRAFSAYQMFLNYGKQLGEFAENLQECNGIYEESLYGKHMQRWIDAGYGDQMHVILFDDLVESPFEVLRSLSKIMCLDSPLCDSYVGHSVNTGGLDKSKALSLLRQGAGKTLRRLGMHGSIHAMKRNSLVKWLNNVNKTRLVMDSNSKDLAKKFFESDVERLDSLFPALNVKTRWGYGERS